MGRQDVMLSWEVGLGIGVGKGLQERAEIVEFVVVGGFLKVCSLVFCWSKKFIFF